MRKELDKYGIQMPQFNKIGGILANELSVDEATCRFSIVCFVNKSTFRFELLQFNFIFLLLFNFWPKAQCFISIFLKALKLEKCWTLE